MRSLRRALERHTLPHQWVDPNFREPYTAEWNLDIQRAITNNLTLDVAYVGNHGFDETNKLDLNEPAIGTGWAGTAATNCINSAPAL